MEPKELQVGFNPYTGKTDSVQLHPNIWKPWRFCWVRKTSLWWAIVLQVVLSYYVAFCCCNRLVVSLFQLSLEFERLTEFDIHSRFEEKISTNASNILNVECTVQKEKLAVLQIKIWLFRREEEKSCKFIHSVNHLFQISKFSSRLKITTLSNINAISKKQLCCYI